MKTKKLLLTLAVTLCGSIWLHAASPTPPNAPAEFPLTLADIRVRDPFILAEDGTYFLYAQGGNRERNDNAEFGIEVYRSRDLVHWSEPKKVFERPKEGFWGNPPIWAPEVHKLEGAYYMFATFVGRAGGRGTQILRAESPEGPFVVVGAQANTPPEQECLDGTPWIDPDGTNWMIYCHAWTQIKDGTYLAVKMKNDWSARIGDPVLLFKASQGPWVRPHPRADTFVTDGPFLYRMKNGKLAMIWSSFFNGHGYGMGQAISESGTVAGPWRHVEKPFFGGEGEDGGHAMIFRDFSGELLLVLHQPNGGNLERAKIYRLKEENDILVVDGFWAPKADEKPANAHRLRMEVVRTLPTPVIDNKTPGTESNPGGFEGGSSVKLMVDGKPEYHFFSHGYPKMDWSQSRLEHWASPDGLNFHRVSVLMENFRDEKAGMNHIFCAPIPFYDEKSERWHLVYCEFIDHTTWTADSGIIWCAASKTAGMKGIGGPYDFDNRYLLVPKACPKIGEEAPNAVSSSAPFQVKDGRWAVLVSTDYVIKDEKSGAKMRRWPVMVNFSSSPLGPFKPAQEAVVSPLMNPTGFIENPIPLKVRGPKSGRDYWVTVFDFLGPEVAGFTPKNVFGFSCSEDGVHWPVENGQVVNIDAGLAAGERGWWSGDWAVRTPHRLIDEGDGTYTIYFTGGSAYHHFGAFRAVGKVTVRLVEEEIPSTPAH